MLRRLLAILALALVACTSVPDASRDVFSNAGPDIAYRFDVLNTDYDASEVRFYCDSGAQLAVLRNLALNQRVVKNVFHGGHCSSINFVTVGVTSEVLYRSPPIGVNDGDRLEVVLAEYPNHTRWRIWRGAQAGS